MKIYKMELYYEDKNKKFNILEWFITLILNALVLELASTIFKDFYLESFYYAIITAMVIMILNKVLKPLLKFLAFPVTLMSLGVLYPFVNVIILKVASLIMGNHFDISGWFVPFFISIFISFLTIFVDSIVCKVMMGVRK